jgi:hypothetical protein
MRADAAALESIMIRYGLDTGAESAAAASRAAAATAAHRYMPDVAQRAFPRGFRRVTRSRKRKGLWLSAAYTDAGVTRCLKQPHLCATDVYGKGAAQRAARRGTAWARAGKGASFVFCSL